MSEPLTDMSCRNGILEKVHAFQEQLMDIDSLDKLIALSCSVLDSSLYLCDPNGFLIGYSMPDERTCPSFRKSIVERKVDQPHLYNILSPNPICNVVRDPNCTGDPCSRLSFPVSLDGYTSPGAITFFLWNRTASQEDQLLCSMVAASFSVWMRRFYHVDTGIQARRIRLMRELLNYRPGLRSYFISALTLEGLHTIDQSYQLICCLAETNTSSVWDALCERIGHLFPNAWIFVHKDTLLILTKEADLTPDKCFKPFIDLLLSRKVHACISLPFHDFLSLRRIFESTLSTCRIAVRKNPDQALYKAADFLSLTFLHRCQQYFPLEEYYIDGFRRLVAYDQANQRTYLSTLSAYLGNGMNINAASKHIFMHRNTMAQQLEKIESILGFSLTDPDLCWYLQLCLRIHELTTL